MSNFFKVASQSQLPPIDGTNALVGDMGYTLDDGGFWIAQQPSAPPGANPVWSFVDVLRGAPGPQGATGYGVPGPQGAIGPPGLMGGIGPQGPAGKSAFSNLSQAFPIPCVGDAPFTIQVTDTSWMAPGMLIFLPGAGTFTVVGSPIDANNVQIINSGDPTNTPCGTMLGAGVAVSQANLRGPVGPQGISGPQGPPGPQGVAGASVFSTLTASFTLPPVNTSAVALVQNAAPFSAGQIVYLAGGDYCSVQSTNPTTNSLDLTNLGYLGTPAGTVLPVGTNVSATGPQGPQGIQGPVGPPGPQGVMGTAPTGAMIMWPTGTAPAGWLLCQGQSLLISAYPNLFSIISNSYGGDGISNFKLPNLQGSFPLGAGTLGANTYTLTKTVDQSGLSGEAKHILTIAELAAHNHSATSAAHTHGLASDSHYHNILQLIDNAQRGSDFNVLKYAQGTPSLSTAAAASGIVLASTAASVSVANNGSGSGHNNMPPYLTINFVIKT